MKPIHERFFLASWQVPDSTISEVLKCFLMNRRAIFEVAGIGF